jgi:hypothetical protein
LDAHAGIHWETGGNFFMKAEFLGFNGSTVSLHSNDNTVMQVETLHCQHPDTMTNNVLSFSADNHLQIQATDFCLQASDTLTLSNAGAKIVFEGGCISLSSPSEIEFIGDSVQFIGAQERGF